MVRKPLSLLDKCSQAARRMGAVFPVSAANDNRLSIKGFLSKGLFLLIILCMLAYVVGHHLGLLRI